MHLRALMESKFKASVLRQGDDSSGYLRDIRDTNQSASGKYDFATG
jgi:hypothetical protein